MFEQLRFLAVLPNFVESVRDKLTELDGELKDYNNNLSQAVDLCLGFGSKSYEKNFLKSKLYNRYHKYIAQGIPPNVITDKLAIDFHVSPITIKTVLEKHKYDLKAYTRFAKRYAINALRENNFKNKEIAKILKMSENSVYRLQKEPEEKHLNELREQYQNDFLSKWFLKEYNKKDDDIT